MPFCSANGIPHVDVRKQKMSTYKAIFRKVYLKALWIGFPIVGAMFLVGLFVLYISLTEMESLNMWIHVGMSLTIILSLIYAMIGWWKKRNQYFGRYEVEFIWSDFESKRKR